MSARHELKTWPVYFQRVWKGEKTFEVRLDDRGYQKGDTVVLREWDPKATCSCPANPKDHPTGTCSRYSGRNITARIGFVMASTPARGSTRGFVGMGYVVFSLCDPENHDGRGADVSEPAPSPSTTLASGPAALAAIHRAGTRVTRLH